MKRTKNVTVDPTPATSAKNRGAAKGITLVQQCPKSAATHTAPAPVTADIRAMDLKIGLELLTPEQRMQLLDYHRIRAERAKARSLERAS